MKVRSRILAHLAAGLACAPEFACAQADALTHDPFARPALLKPAPPAASGAREAGAAGESPAPPWRPELSAVLVAGQNSAVNIEGRIVRIGEVIDGHRLVEVHEQTAVFVKNRARVTLSLSGSAAPPPAPPARTNASPKPESK